MIEIRDNCLANIIKMKEANCNMQMYKDEEVTEITTGIIITKNLKSTYLIQNCNDLNIKIEGNKLIKIENCKVKINDIEFENIEIKIHDHLVLPNFLTKIKENITFYNVNLEELHINNIENTKKIEKVMYQNNYKHVTSFSIQSIVILIIVISLIVIICKKKNKRTVNIDVKNTSSEPQINVGGVVAAAINKPNII